MAIAKKIYKWERLVPVRFSRLISRSNPRKKSGSPRSQHPDMDDRGYVRHGNEPIVSLIQGTRIRVRLSRESIEKRVKIYATSNDISVIKVKTARPGARLPSDKHAWIQINAKAGKGGNPAMATVQIRFGTDTGPVISELLVHIFKPVRVNVTPHLVTISKAAVGPIAAVVGVAPTIELDKVMKMVKAIWKPCGVRIGVQPFENDTINLATANIVASGLASGGEADRVLGFNSTPNSINLYIVKQIGTGNTLGYGISRASQASMSLTNPGIILAESNASGTVRDTQYWANDLAHEIGHFFKLWHPDNKQAPNVLKDSWSRRMLMHNYNRTLGTNPRSNCRNTGYGTNAAGTAANRGCLITSKNYSRHATDGESKTARATISSRSGPY